MNNKKSIIGYLIMISITILGINSTSAQTLYREYSDNSVYMFINNYQMVYWQQGPKMPHHELEIMNIGSQTVDIRVLIRVVLRNDQGSYLDETTEARTITIYPGETRRETIWMRANKGKSYYCVEGFRVLSVTKTS